MLEQSGADLCRAQQTGTKQTNAGTEQSRPARRGPGPRAAWFQGCLRAMLFSGQCCFIIELFALNQVSFFIAPQFGDSCWRQIDANDLQLTLPNPGAQNPTTGPQTSQKSPLSDANPSEGRLPHTSARRKRTRIYRTRTEYVLVTVY